MNTPSITLDQLAKIFDNAIASDVPAVKNSLNNLIMATTISHANDVAEGPFSSMVRRIVDLENRVAKLEMNGMTYGLY